MEAKLKQLKVADLKDILTRAQVSIPGRANKPELMALIQGSPKALAVYDDLHGGGSVRPSGANTPKPPVENVETKAPPVEPIKISDILAPPEPFDWTAGIEPSGETTKKNGTTSNKTVPAKPPSAKATASATSVAAAPSTTSQNASETKKEEPAADEDEEEKKRRTRAERFGIPVVTGTVPSQKKEPAKATADKSATAAAKSNGTGAGVKTKTEKIPTAIGEDPEKLKARAMRFGLVEKTKHVKPSPEAAAAVTGQKQAAATNAGQKRAAPPVEKDDDEAERRRKRAERFGLPVKT